MKRVDREALDFIWGGYRTNCQPAPKKPVSRPEPLPLPRKPRRSRAIPGKTARAKARRLERIAANGGVVTQDDRDLVLSKYGKICLKCRDTVGPIVMDHVISLYRGGSNSRENLQPLCYRCNLRKNIACDDYRSA